MGYLKPTVVVSSSTSARTGLRISKNIKLVFQSTWVCSSPKETQCTLLMHFWWKRSN